LTELVEVHKIRYINVIDLLLLSWKVQQMKLENMDNPIDDVPLLKKGFSISVAHHNLAVLFGCLVTQMEVRL
jgi:hypothetical protein